MGAPRIRKAIRFFSVSRTPPAFAPTRCLPQPGARFVQQVSPPRDLQVRHTCGARACSATRGAHRRVDGGPIRGTCAAAGRQLLVREPLRRRPAAARRGQPVRSGRCASEYCEPVRAAPPTAGSNGPADAGEPFRPADADAAAVPVRGAAAAAGAARNAQAHALRAPSHVWSRLVPVADASAVALRGASAADAAVAVRCRPAALEPETRPHLTPRARYSAGPCPHHPMIAPAPSSAARAVETPP